MCGMFRASAAGAFAVAAAALIRVEFTEYLN